MVGGGWTASDLAKYYLQADTLALLKDISETKPMAVAYPLPASASAPPPPASVPAPPPRAVQQDEPSPPAPPGKPGNSFGPPSAAAVPDKPPGKPGNPFANGAPENPFAAIRDELESAGMFDDVTAEPTGGDDAADE